MTRLVTIDLDSPEVLEALADVQHEIWAHWMKYQFSCCSPTPVDACEEFPYGAYDYVVPARKVGRWVRQMEMPYGKLSEQEKDSDREQVLKVLKVLEQRGAAVFCVPALPINPDDDALIDKLVERVSAKLETRPLTRRADTTNPFDPRGKPCSRKP